MTQGCDCPHQADRHFPNGKCAVMYCMCVRQPEEETMTLSDVIDGPKREESLPDEGKRSPFWLPPVDSDAAWKRALGEIVFSVGGLQEDVHQLSRDASNRAQDIRKVDQSLTDLKAVVEQNEVYARAHKESFEIWLVGVAQDNQRINAIGARLGDFKLSRKGKKRGKK